MSKKSNNLLKSFLARGVTNISTLPINVVSTKKVKKTLFATIATVTVLSQMLTVYPTTSAAAETGTGIQTAAAATEVGDFATLKQVIEADNGITNIVFTADITMTAGILIQAKKEELTIDGNGFQLTESSVNAGNNTATIYMNGASKLKTLNVKNLTIRGSHWYGPFTNMGGNAGVTQNFENIDYAGPQFIYNLYGYANFTGKNKIVISRPLNNLGTLAEMAEVTGVTISGEFSGEHTNTAAYPFNLYNSTGGGTSYFTIKDDAKVDFKAGGLAFISAPTNTASFSVGKNATFTMNTVRQLFQSAMANVTFDNGSTTTINRTDTTTSALMEVGKTFTINPNANLSVTQPATSGAHIIRTTAANAVVNINDPGMLDLNANGTGANRVFSAFGRTTINFNSLAEIGVFNATNKTEVPDLAWQNATFSVVQTSGQAGTVQAGAISTPENIQTTFVLANAKRITMTGTTALAERAVNALFNSNDPATDAIKETTTQESIDAAQKLVDAVTDPDAKIVIQKNLDRAQELLDARNEAIADKARQAAALKAVNELFNSDKPSTDAIKATTDQAAIDAAQKLVDAVTDPTVKEMLQKDLDRAQELLDAINAEKAAEKARQEAALKAVNELFNSDKPSTDAIKATTTQDSIDAAQKLVDAVTDPTNKAALQKDLDRAQELLDARNAANAAEKARQEAALKAVNELFNSDKPATDAIKETTNQDAIDAAQKLVDAVTDPTVKAELQKDLDRAQELLDARIAAEKAAQDKARAAVNNLFASQNPTGDIKAGLTQADIDAAQALIDQVTDPAKKAELQADLDKAQKQLDERLAAELEAQNKAREAVNNLFTSKDPTGDAKAGLTQAEIDAAQALIDKVTDPAKKAELQADLDKAQAQLDARNAAELEAQNKAREAVNNLFTSKDPTGNIKTGLTQAEIDAAQALIDKVTDPAKKAELQADLDKAQAQLDSDKSAEQAAQDKARAAVNALFANQNPTGDAKAGLTQAEIDAAQALIDKVTDPTKKAELQADLDKAQAQLDARIAAEKAAQDKARAAVNALFAYQNPAGDAKIGLTQAEIDAAQALINQVTDPVKKAELQADLDKAQAQLDARNAAELEAQNKAREAVNNLFTSKDPTGDAKAGLTQAEIDAAQALIDKVTDPAKKAELQADLDKAQAQLDARIAAEKAAQDKARAAVNALFANNNPAGNTKTGLTQAEIDAAQALIDKVTDPAKKAELQADLDKAQAQLNANLVAPTAPTVNTVTAVDTKVTGKGQAGMTAVVKLADGTEKTGVVNANGDFSIVIPAQAADSKIAVTLKNTYGVASEATTVTVVGLPQPVINPMTISDVTVTGTIDVSQFPASKVKLIINGAPKTILTVGADGSFSYYTGNLAAGTTIEVQYVGPNGAYLTDSQYVGTTVVTEAAVSLVLNEMTVSDMYITGTTLANHRVRVSVNGVVKTTVTSDASGNFSYLSSYLVKGDVVKAEVLLGTNVAKTVSITVTEAAAAELVVNEMTIADNTVTGTATPNAKLRISINGVAKAVVTGDATGKYTYATGTLASGTEVKVEMRNAFTGAYDTSKTVVVSGEIPGLLLTLNELKAPAGDVSGEATAGYTVRISVNGVVKANVVVNAEGQYAYNVGVLTGGDVVKAEVRVGTQYVLATERTVKAEFSINPILDTDRTITGKAPAGKTVRISINGVPKSITVADAAGNYTYLIGLVATGDVIKIELRNTETGKYEDFVERTVISAADAGQVTINALTSADTMVTGKTIPSGKLRISVDGKAKTVVTADAQGNYSYFISGVTVGQVIKVELKENSAYTSFAETTVTEAPAAE
ncbi:toxin Cry1Ac domain D-VI-related protein [Listeria newyorkensis]|uniref:Bacterial Ig domain-containing protein n=1 Tax=Listeria newyorkensis TaxID=1497681 RepID=A0A841YZZ9_9LIST|nr:toxin Cry1Ac domain D-VI-related protein [Listeria newyorkensis]MBC1459094.1 hypothetical protein [Listeria newyorkensis]